MSTAVAVAALSRDLVAELDALIERSVVQVVAQVLGRVDRASDTRTSREKSRQHEGFSRHSTAEHGDEWPWDCDDPHPADRGRQRPKSLGMAPLNEKERAFRDELRRLPVVDDYLPDRSECVGGHRPCPLIRCPHNLYADETPDGALKLNFPSREPWEMPPNESCALDIADEYDRKHQPTQEDIGRVMNLSWRGVRRIEQVALAKLRANPEARALLEEVRARTRRRVDRKYRRVTVVNEDKSAGE